MPAGSKLSNPTPNNMATKYTPFEAAYEAGQKFRNQLEKLSINTGHDDLDAALDHATLAITHLQSIIRAERKGLLTPTTSNEAND